jgi:hypothetical protein
MASTRWRRGRSTRERRLSKRGLAEAMLATWEDTTVQTYYILGSIAGIANGR